MKTKLLALCLALFAAINLFAADFEYDGIAYKILTENTVEVTSKSPKYYADSVMIPETVTYNGITYSVTTIGYCAFYNCKGLTSITIPNSVTKIEYEAFRYCFSLTSIVIPNSVTTIGERAFESCHGLTSVTIGNSVTMIGASAFSCCTGLTSVTIPNSVTTIGNYAFNLVNNIVYNGTDSGSPWGAKCVNGYVEEYFVYSDATKTTLCGCSSAATGKIAIPSSVITIGDDTFWECSGLTLITIGNSVTTIGEMAFTSCTGLTSIEIPNSVTTIGKNAFSECNGLISVTIPNSVTTIGNKVFAYCYGLTSITCYAVAPPECGDDVFYNINQDAKVYVPASALTDYQNAKVWKDMQLYPIAADVTPMDNENPIVTPSDQDVTITWPITDGTATYTLTITKNGETVCVLTFNANGQLINIAFAASGHNGAHQAPAATLTAQGYQFTVTGLNPGTAYDYSVTATDAGGKTLAEYKGNFSTTGGESDLQNVRNGVKASKYFHNGNLIIERNGVKYTPAGQKVR